MLALIIQIVPQCIQIYARRRNTKEKEKAILTLEKIGIRWPQAQEISWSHWKLYKVGTITLEPLWEMWPSQHGFQTFGLENGEKTSGCCLKCQVLGNSFFRKLKHLLKKTCWKCLIINLLVWYDLSIKQQNNYSSRKVIESLNLVFMGTFWFSLYKNYFIVL